MEEVYFRKSTYCSEAYPRFLDCINSWTWKNLPIILKESDSLLYLVKWLFTDISHDFWSRSVMRLDFDDIRNGSLWWFDDNTIRELIKLVTDQEKTKKLNINIDITKNRSSIKEAKRYRIMQLQENSSFKPIDEISKYWEWWKTKDASKVPTIDNCSHYKNMIEMSMISVLSILDAEDLEPLTCLYNTNDSWKILPRLYS